MNREYIRKWFYIVMFSFITLFLFLLFLDPLGCQLNVFFEKTTNFLADFFNVQIYIADWDPYHNTLNGIGEKCYLPFTYLFLELFNGFYSYSGANLNDCYMSSEAVLSAVMLMAFSLLVFFHALCCMNSMPNKLKYIIFFSSVVLFSLERGNVIILCAALMCYFLAFKQSNNRWLRYFSLICLCIASVIKIYPAILGLYLLKEKRYKAIAGCMILSLFLSLFPFIFFCGQFDNIGQLIKNVYTNSLSYSAFRVYPRFGISPLVAWPLKALHIDDSIVDLILLIPKLLTLLLCLLSFGLFYIEKENWKRLALIIFPLMYFPTNSAFYCGMYFIPVILIFINDNQGRKLDFLYMLLICLFLSPLQLPAIKGITISHLLSNFSLLIMWSFLLIETTMNVVQQRKTIRQ